MGEDHEADAPGRHMKVAVEDNRPIRDPHRLDLGC
jgi:hypothetical protein